MSVGSKRNLSGFAGDSRKAEKTKIITLEGEHDETNGGSEG